MTAEDSRGAPAGMPILPRATAFVEVLVGSHGIVPGKQKAPPKRGFRKALPGIACG